MERLAALPLLAPRITMLEGEGTGSSTGPTKLSLILSWDL